MKRKLRSGKENFFEYNRGLIQLSEENFGDKKSKDITSFWISLINFELHSKSTMGIFEYNSSKLSYGLNGVKLELQDLTSEELNEIIEYYSKKGYILNQIDNIVIRDSDAIIIEWSNPIKQNLREKLYILKFSCSKLKKLFNINKFKNTFLRTIVLTFKDFYWYYFWNDSYCVNATRLYRKTLKSRKYIEKRNKTS